MANDFGRAALGSLVGPGRALYAPDALEENAEWHFNKRLRAARAYRCLTQREVADHLGVDRSSYAYYETGKSHPNMKLVRRICQYLEVSPEYLLGLEQKSD